MKKLLLLTAALILFGRILLPGQQAGTLDLSFGTQGVVRTNFGAGASTMGMGSLADGKILVVGRLSEEGTNSLLVMRFLSNGTPDTDFGISGQIRTSLPAQIGYFIRDFKVNPQDGSFYVCSAINSGGTHTITRFLPDGTLDAGFANGGIPTASTNDPGNFFALELLPDGKLLLGGRIWSAASSRYNFLVRRLHNDGSWDSSFGNNGQTIFEYVTNAEGTALTVYPNGQILLAGSVRSPFSTEQLMGAVRFGPNGETDYTFGTEGIFIGRPGVPKSVRVQSDGKILLGGGRTSFSLSGYFAIERLLPAGVEDIGFGNLGQALTPQPGGLSLISGMEIMADGKLLMQGIVGRKICLMRYLPDGSPDTGFGDAGLLPLDFGGSVFLYAFLLPQQNKLLIAGNIFQDDILLARCNPDGSIDDTFAEEGMTIADFGSNIIGAGKMLLLPDARIVASAVMSNRLVLTRYQPDGTIDDSFHATYISPPYFVIGTPILSVDPQGGILVAGQFIEESSGGGQMYMIRFHADGTLDEMFGADGLVHPTFGPSQVLSSICSALTVLENGKILLGGTYYPVTGGGSYALARFHPNGAPDNTFGVSGTALIPIPGPGRLFCTDMAVQPDGKIVLTGSVQSQHSAYIATARFLPDGLPDASFGSNGIVDTSSPTESMEAFGMTLQPDGKIVVTGSWEGSLCMIRYSGIDGSLDTGFGNSGIFIHGNLIGNGQQVYLQSDGNFLLVGVTYTSTGLSIYLGGVDASGAPDPAFGINGYVITPFTGYHTLSDSKLQPDGKILVAERIAGTHLLARFHTNFSVSTSQPFHPVFDLKAYPNPVEEAFSLEYTLPRPETLHIRLLDASGRQVHTYLAGTLRMEGLHREIFHLPKYLLPGWYVIQVETNQGSAQVRIIKQR